MLTTTNIILGSQTTNYIRDGFAYPLEHSQITCKQNLKCLGHDIHKAGSYRLVCLQHGGLYRVYGGLIILSSVE